MEDDERLGNLRSEIENVSSCLSLHNISICLQLKSQLDALNDLGPKLQHLIKEAVSQLADHQDERYQQYQRHLKDLEEHSTNYDKKFHRLESEVDNMMSELRSIDAAKEMVNGDNESFLKKSHEIDLEHLRMEIIKALEEYESARPEQQMSQQEVTRLVEDAINKRYPTAITQEVINRQMESHIDQNLSSSFQETLHSAITDVLRKFSYDKTGEADFAYENSGMFYNDFCTMLLLLYFRW